MAYLESLRVIHRDLCLENVLLDEASLTVQITGFGGARDVYELESYVASMRKPVNSSFAPSNSRAQLLETTVGGPVYEDFAYHLRIRALKRWMTAASAVPATAMLLVS